MQKKRVSDFITDAVFELLKSKKLENITTTEIIQKAGVCRASFYRNFYLPEDVIRQYGIALFEEIDQKIIIAQTGIREHIYSVNMHLWNHRERLTLLENRGLFHLLEEPIMNHCMLQIQRLGVRYNRYYAAYHTGATVQMIRAWVHSGFEESPEEISKLICDLVSWKFP